MPELKLNTATVKAVENVLMTMSKKRATEVIDEVMDDAVDFTWEAFGNAKYAGESVNSMELDVYTEETGSLEREIVVEGPLIGFIEYGTGVKSVAPGSKRKLGWMFKANGRRIALNGLSIEARPRKRKYRYETDEKGRFREEGDWLDTREGVFYTQGNPPNYIMPKVKAYIKSRIMEELVEQ